MKYLGWGCSWFQLKGVLPDCCAQRRCLNLGERPPGCRKRMFDRSLCILFYFILFASFWHVGQHAPKKGLRKENHHFTEGDMGAKPQVLEGSSGLRPLGDRES